MPPQKKSIRDFFRPVQKTEEVANGQAPKQPGLQPYTATPLRHETSKPQTSPQSNNSPNASSTNINPSRSTTSNNNSFTTSQSSAHSGSTSKRVVSNGEDVVLNSDSDSDSLPELNWNLPSKPLNVQRPKPVKDENDLRKPPQNKKDGKAFIKFMHNVQKKARSERQIAEVKADLEKPVVEEPPSAHLDINEETLGNIIGDNDDPNKAKKLFHAMQRTNALQTDCVFHLWRTDWVDRVMNDSPFPIDCLPNHQWASIFEEAKTRDQAFASGFALQVFRIQHLPIELASWMVDQICQGRNELLSDRYLEVLKCHHNHLRALLDKARISSIFAGIGTDSLCLDHQRPIAPSFELENDVEIPAPNSLHQICRLFQTATRRLSLDTNDHLLYVLFHLCIDISVGSDAGTLAIVQHTIETIICNVSDNKDLASILNNVIPSFLRRVDHPILQRQLIESLPARSPLTAYLQRHLALSFLLHPKVIEVPLDRPEMPALVGEHIQNSPQFHVNKNTDYAHLAARLAMLDIAIGPGLSSVPYQPLLSLPPSPVGEESINLPSHLTRDEKLFNEQVDALAHHVESISSSIVESGGIVDLSRLQAKDCSERIYHRLQNAVRIGGKQKFSIFGSSEMDFDHAVWKGFTKFTTRSKVKGQMENNK